MVQLHVSGLHGGRHGPSTTACGYIPEHDAGGVANNGFKWNQVLKDRFNAGNWSYTSHGMCGRSNVRTGAFLDAYDTINWTRLADMKLDESGIGRHSDITLALLMMDYGFILRPWRDSHQKYTAGSAGAKVLH
mmetsp:Transcript_6098/g.10141  ORF Transcript_6098/g.10141 Transcript_6098/m.10141 type:complete len:133 (-) Transcript_6098:135-533(-)|eukprot:CAMPEP_0119015492 /NCGR_PEP_ID=MMETSP1176-20130426/11142_1 /TAXON_ID=265551 /ORGANISM="Synedropsis recta cf, Strain CCMP1620" /LENGTH=132 /DNA_ID=CAMNT_0006968789 /DNA_START=161 /DNA_END=559 /DNA_ORIENTATION=+